MNKDEIKKALECCTDDIRKGCGDCPYKKEGKTYLCKNNRMLYDVLALITEQEKEIERLKADNERFKNNMRAVLEIEKKQAVKEFAKKVKERCHNYYPSIDHYCCSEKAVNVKDIDELLKEYE